MSRTVQVPLEELESLLFAAVERGLKNGGVFHKAGMIGPDIVLRTTAGLAAAGRITPELTDQTEVTTP